MRDAYANLAYAVILTPPSPPVSGTTLVLAPGWTVAFPAPPFNVTIWPLHAIPTIYNAEIARVTAIVGDTVTLLRAQEGTTARLILAGDQLAETFTLKLLTELRFHALTHGPGGEDALKLDDLAVPDNVTDLNATTGRHGLLPRLSGDPSTVLSGSGTWVPAGTGGGGSVSGEWSILTNGDVDTPELIFAGGDVITTFLPVGA